MFGLKLFFPTSEPLFIPLLEAWLTGQLRRAAICGLFEFVGLKGTLQGLIDVVVHCRFYDKGLLCFKIFKASDQLALGHMVLFVHVEETLSVETQLLEFFERAADLALHNELIIILKIPKPALESA